MPSLPPGTDPASLCAARWTGRCTGRWTGLRGELALAPGLPGSGRRRYAAAMWFHLNADLPGEVLEVFRALAMDDAADPLRELDRIGMAQAARHLRAGRA